MSSNTKNLGLYKVDPKMDGNQTFNIDTMLNENWDKIDEAVSNVSVPVQSVNNKTGDVTLTSEDIRLKDGESIEEFKSKATTLMDNLALQNSYMATKYQLNKAQLEILELKSEIEKQNIINFINKTGIGFYDIFDTNENIDTVNTTTTVDTTNKKVSFTGQQVLKMNNETFDNFSNINLRLNSDKTNAVEVSGDVTDSTSVSVKNPTRNLNIGDRLFIDNKENRITNIADNTEKHDIQDTTVINKAYSTQGNGGRKLVRLDNGWLVAVIFAPSSIGNNFNIHISKDNVETWTEKSVLHGGWSTGYITCEAVGNYLYVMYHNNSNQATYVSYKAYKVENDDLVQIAYSYEVDTAQTGIFNGCMVANKEGTELHACWSSKNSTYPNTYNIRYRKGVIGSDGSIAWGSVEQVTKRGTSEHHCTNPTIILNHNNAPVILYAYNETSGWNRILYNLRDSSGSWGNATLGRTLYNADGHIQSSPSTVFVPKEVNGLDKGRIWVAWHGNRADNNSSIESIMVSYSDDGGATWSTAENLTDGVNDKSSPSITANKNNEIFIMYWGWTNSKREILKLENKNGTWSNEINISNNELDEGTLYPSALFDTTFSLDFTEPTFIYQNSHESRVGFYGTWEKIQGYSLTLANQVTLTNGEKILMIDFEVTQENASMKLNSISNNQYDFSLDSLNTLVADIKITGKDNELNSMAYAIS